MGGSSSKAPTVAAPEFDLNKAKIALPDLQDFQASVQQSAAQANAKLAEVSASASSYKWYMWFAIILGIVGGIAYVIYTYVYPAIYRATNNNASPPPLGSALGPDLSIRSATIAKAGEDNKDVTQQVIDRVSNNRLNINVDPSFGATEGSQMVVKYQYPNQGPGSVTAVFGSPIVIEPPGTEGVAANQVPSSFFGQTNYLPVAKDAKQTSTISISPNADGGDYGYQFWMYVTDWNYKFGKDKNIMMRTDASNAGIMNPSISLHPTDNVMKVSVSIFPSSDGSSKLAPAPAGHSGSADDVYVCDVPNIPLNTWVAVAVTLSTRNLDIYLNGLLVKSCVLSGVPKPVTGSAILNADGGFSGYMCSFYHYPKLLKPIDAQSFFNSGVPCSVPGTSGSYKVAVGVNNAKGEVVKQYMF